MHIPAVIPLIGALSLASASPLSHLKTAERSQEGISWGPCNKTELKANAVAVVPTSMQCATLKVPLDYADKKSNKQLALSLIKVAAEKKPADGKTKSILFNFGGPGSEARSTLLSFSSLLLAETGGIYDLVAFDPRGTAETIPFACAKDVLTDYVQIQSGLKFNDNSTDTLGSLWATAQATANRCADYNDETGLGDKISTPAVARDMISVVDALQEDGLLRYWGVSYGTTLGATLLALFPDRVESVVLDGVQNPHQYYNDLVDTQQWSDADAQFSAIFPACVKNPDACPLAKRSPKATAEELEQQIWDLLAHVQKEPLVFGSQVIDYTSVKNQIAQTSYNYYDGALTKLTTILAAYLDLAENKDIGSPSPSDDSTANSTLSKVPSVLTLLGIQCLDQNKRLPEGSTVKDFIPASKELYASSRTIGDASLFQSMVCANWKIEPTEKFNTDFKIKPRKPVLILGNTYDGHTPLKSAYNVSSTVDSSAVVELDGYGHSSLSVPSSCMLRTVSDYWVHGKTPKNGTHCTSNSPLFSNVTWSTVLKKTGNKKSQRSLPLTA